MIRAAIAAALLAAWLAGPPARAQQPVEETPEMLPDGPGRDETFYLCTPCHSSALVRQQGLTRERWAGTLDWMTQRHGMVELPDEERNLILNYLAQHFGPRETAPRGGFVQPRRTNPFSP